MGVNDTCPACHEPITPGAKFCAGCGASLEDAPAGPSPVDVTIDAPVTPSRTVPAGRTGLGSSGSGVSGSSGARFAPGTVFAGRYRVVGLLGRGGMGEVYRADDLTLDQPVALKFLPPELTHDPDRLERFRNEVKIARQVGHPNVCRVYDIGEAEGLVYLTMEYVDGEDLSVLLRRIGRLPHDKALEIARQLCAGLAASHDRGVLHRDLKPANVMLDGDGNVRITDFGLAALTEDAAGDRMRAGTPAYMAPEQLAEGRVSAQSDLYALGLVLYEVFTGRPTYKADTLAEISRLHAEGTPASPTTVIETIDPAVERAILRCLEKEATERPRSALEVAASLPGGDPLAAALAAGEIPSPEMVAAAGKTETTRPALIWAMFVLVILVIALMGPLADRALLVHMIDMDKPPQVLVERARTIAGAMGIEEEPADEAWGFGQDTEYLQHVRDVVDRPDWWDTLASDPVSPVVFWYRRSPRSLIPGNPWGRVTPGDPTVNISGMVRIWLDSGGQLRGLLAVPPEREDSLAAPAFPPADWSLLFGEAGLDPARFQPVESRWNPATYRDERAAWVGSFAERPDTEVRVEAGAYRGQPMYFSIIGDWSRPTRMITRTRGRAETVSGIAGFVIFVGILLGAILLARRNLKTGRGDRRGASRVAWFVFAVLLLVWLLSADHAASRSGLLQSFFAAVGYAGVWAAMTWILYVAVEPFVRRYWPDRIISWSRVLTGRFKDPLVGRNVLAGVAIGTAVALINMLRTVSPAWMGRVPGEPQISSTETLLGIRHAIAHNLNEVNDGIVGGMFVLLLLLVLRLALRRDVLAWVAFYLVMFGLGFVSAVSEGGGTAVTLAFGAVLSGLVLLSLHFGLLTAMVMSFTSGVLMTSPLTSHGGDWFAPNAAVAVAMVAFLAIYGLRAALTSSGIPSVRLPVAGKPDVSP